MLKIRPEQFEIFESVADAGFEKRVMEYLRAEQGGIPVQLASGTFTIGQIADDTLQEMVRNGIARARRYGTTWESTLTSFIVIMLIVAPNFDEHPLIRQVLNDPEIEADLRVDELLEVTSEETWAAAKEDYDANAWALKIEEV